MPTTVNRISVQIKATAEKLRQRSQQALDAASQKLADNILAAGRDDISGAGKFGTRWTMGFTSEISGEGSSRVLTFKEAVPYWRIFQYGGIIHGQPLLWIPLSHTDITVRARDFPGRLFRVNRKSGAVPLLLSRDDRQPKYSGHEQVRIPKKFHLVEIIRAESRAFGALYSVELTRG